MLIKSKNIIVPFLVTLIFGITGAQCKKDSETPAPPPTPQEDALSVTKYLSTSDGNAKFVKQDDSFYSAEANSFVSINVDVSTEYQEMDGFGFSLTGGSALHLNNMSTSKRKALLNELFAYDEENIGISYLRISIGASDLDAEPFSYNDLLDGQTDVNLDQFSIEPDRDHLIPVLKEILEINPDIKILGSPWSAPAWMKTNGSTKGGELKEEYYEVYANYFVKYIQAMASEGITIDAITIQNEPLHPGNNPSMYMEPEAQASFVKNALGPAFETAGISTKIIVYDHNADRTDYPITIFNDSEANKFIDGSAFHLYGGSIDDLVKVHNAYPDKNLYFTEQWIGAPGNFGNDIVWHTENLIIGASRNWCKTVLEWNLASNSNLEPHTDGGCTQCLGALTIDGDDVSRNPAYYIIAHASKFARPGSVRIATNIPSGLPNVAFSTPDGEIVLVVVNTSGSEIRFNIDKGAEMFVDKLAANSVATYVWK